MKLDHFEEKTGMIHTHLEYIHTSEFPARVHTLEKWECVCKETQPRRWVMVVE